MQTPVHVQSIFVCGARYLQHGHVQVPAPIPWIQAAEPPSDQSSSTCLPIANAHPYLNSSMATPWASPCPVQGTMDQQRRTSIQYHPSGVPASSVPAYYSNPPASTSHKRQSSPFPGATRMLRANANQPSSLDFTLLIFPYPVCVALLPFSYKMLHTFQSNIPD